MPDGLPSTDQVAKQIRDFVASRDIHKAFLLPHSLDSFVDSPSSESLMRLVTDVRAMYVKTPDLMIILWYSLLAAAQSVTDVPALGLNGWRQKLLAHFLTRDGCLCVLTTNWDTSLDSILDQLRSSGAAGLEAIEYGARFRGQKGLREASTLQLLKLNGAADWFFCDSCRELSTTRMIRLERGLPTSWDPMNSAVLCRNCKRLMDRPLVLPAVGDARNPLAPFEDFQEHGDLTQIHARAAVAIARAWELIFIGYSLPLYDSSIRALLKLGLNRNAAIAAGSAKVTVVTFGQDSEQTRRRFAEILGRADFAFCPDGLQRFVSKL